MPSVTVRRVPRPFNRHVLGKGLLARAGASEWRRVRRLGARAVVNGGNCELAAINWVHYLHAAYEPSVAGSVLRRSKTMLTHRRDVATERRALQARHLAVEHAKVGDVQYGTHSMPPR